MLKLVVSSICRDNQLGPLSLVVCTLTKDSQGSTLVLIYSLYISLINQVTLLWILVLSLFFQDIDSYSFI